ncbi:hypothetical protein MPSEU_000141800 [Mayamaea pseudoterrestris]|nr:hypothetical protein MPSEU_000141800 [Mayamaea pseudoterrestris]
MKLLFAAVAIWLLPAPGQSAVTFARHEYHYFPYIAYKDFGDGSGSQAAAAAYADSLIVCGVRGHLADLTTREEFQAITASGIVTGHNVWIGLTYSESEGKYIWTTGQPLSTVPNNDNWNSPTEPNGVLIGENCVIIESSTGKWYDTVCSTPGYDVLVEFDCAYPSPAAIRVVSGHRYEYYTTASLSLSWEAAVVACAQMVRCGVYGHLVTLTTKTEQDAVKLAFQSQFSSDTKASWIGLSDTITEGTFLWVNGETYVKDDPNNAVFVTGEPNDYDGFPPGEDCVSQRLSDSLLNDQLCGDAITQGGICEFDSFTKSATKQLSVENPIMAPKQGTESDTKPHSVQDAFKKPEQGTESETEPHSVQDAFKKPEQGTESETKPHSVQDPFKTPEQGTESETKPHSVQDPFKTPEQGTESETKPHSVQDAFKTAFEKSLFKSKFDP